MNSLSILHIYLKIFEVFFVVVVWHNIRGGKTNPDIEQIPSVKREELRESPSVSPIVRAEGESHSVSGSGYRCSAICLIESQLTPIVAS